MTLHDGPVIEVENVSKRYVRSEFRPRLRHEATELARHWLRQSGSDSLQSDSFWALRGINFTVKRGEAVGIVGRNGSGKTTLLRILSGITEPSEGTVAVRGRFTTLIGLSAGFDFERTGRENIYFNAALYGFPPAHVKEIIGDIISFSEIEAFLDTPVKRYSSGMVARLGFSIAIHILPEIIFLDEVLSVGDAAFREKCLERMRELKQRQCTIVFVSHDENGLRTMCERSILLHQGAMITDGPTEEVLTTYKTLIRKKV